ncbi:MAG: response regulator transcription factor, partial [Pseudomonadota bacterium]
VVVAHNLKEFNLNCMSQPLDLALIDWELPDGFGLDALIRMKSEFGDSVAALFVTARDEETDVLAAFEAGADDYIVKPAKKAVLMARIKAVSRRANIEGQSNVLELGPIRIDKTSKEVTLHGEPIKMTNKDYRLACCLLANTGKLLSREFLLKTVWGLSSDINTRTVDVHISRIRRALNIGPDIGYTLVNVYQHGYRLEKLPE